jgi:hypothetical protein
LNILHEDHEAVEGVEYLEYAGPKFDHLGSHVVDVDLPQQVVYVHYLRHHLQVELKQCLVLLLVNVLGEEDFCSIYAGFDQVALHKCVSEGEDGVVDVFFDVVGDVLQHGVYTFGMGVLGLALLYGRLAEEL